MDIKSELKRLIDNPLTPNATEWAMDAEDLLTGVKDAFVGCSKTYWYG